MNPSKPFQIALGCAIILFIVGVFTYVGYSEKTPERPVRVVFKGIAGNVLFDHKTHSADTGYGTSCNDCHHNPPHLDEKYGPCYNCHKPEGDTTKPEVCKDCHDPSEIEGFQMLSKTDAYHTQCISCHKQFGAGPTACAECHSTF